MSAFLLRFENLQKVSGKSLQHTLPNTLTGLFFLLDNLFIMFSKVAVGAAAALMAGVVCFWPFKERNRSINC